MLLLHVLFKAIPQRNGLSSNEDAPKVSNWFEFGILPLRLLCERFNWLRNVSKPSWSGMFPERLFQERSSKRSNVIFESADGMLPFKSLCDKSS